MSARAFGRIWPVPARLALLFLAGVLTATASFSDPADSNWSSLFARPGLSGPVYPGAAFSTANFRDTLVIGGQFTFADGQPMANVARWYGGAYHPMGAGFNNTVTSLAVANGALYAAGDFDSSGTNPIGHVARWNGVSWVRLDAGTPDATYGLSLAADGTSLLLLGQFSQVGAPPIAAQYIARWDSSWHAMSGLSIPVQGIARVGTHLYAGGGSYGDNALFDWNGTAWSAVPAYDNNLAQYASFTSLASFQGKLIASGDFLDLQGAAVNGIAQYDGTTWSSLAGIAPDGIIDRIGVDNGRLRVVGQFTSVPGPHVATWNGTAWTADPRGVIAFGGQIASFSRVGSELYYGGSMWAFDDGTAYPAYCGGTARFDGTVTRALGSGHGFLYATQVSALQTFGGQLIASGAFSQTADHSGPLANIAAWNGSAWQPVGAVGLSANGAPSCDGLTLWGSQLVAVGYFSSADNVAVHNIASWDGASWHDVGGGFTAQPTHVVALGSQLIVTSGYGLGNSVTTNAPMGDLARWTGTQWVSIGTRAGSLVGYAGGVLTVWNGKAVYGGSFTSMSGVAANNIAAWNGASWSAMGAGFDGFVNALGIHNNELYACGNFTHSGATLLPGHIARWNGSTWVALTSGFDVAPNSLCSYGGKLYAGGAFSLASGQPANSIAVWDGATWSALGSGLSPVGPVYALAGYAGGLFAGGFFNTAGGRPSAFLAEWLGAATTAVEGSPRALVSGLALAPPWPNPARAGARIAFRLPQAGAVNMAIYDLNGRLVQRLVNNSLPAGAHEQTWDGRDAGGAPAHAGLYWVRVRTDSGEASASITLLR